MTVSEILLTADDASGSMFANEQAENQNAIKQSNRTRNRFIWTPSTFNAPGLGSTIKAQHAALYRVRIFLPNVSPAHG